MTRTLLPISPESAIMILQHPEDFHYYGTYDIMRAALWVNTLANEAFDEIKRRMEQGKLLSTELLSK